MPIPDEDNYYARYTRGMNLLRGRDITGAGFSREEFQQNFVGQSDITMEAEMEDDPEADQAHDWMQTGYTATKDNWPGQIKDLTQQVTDLTAKLAAQPAPVKVPVPEPTPIITPNVPVVPAPVVTPVTKPGLVKQSILSILLESIINLFKKGK